MICQNIRQLNFWQVQKYYQETASQNNAERMDKEISTHASSQGRNRHHFEYWIDYSIDKRTSGDLWE